MLCSLHVIAALDFLAEIDDVDFIYTILRKSLSREEVEKYIKKASYKGDFAMTEACVSKHLKLMYEAGKGRNYEKS